MRTIFKYPVPVDDLMHTHSIPAGSVVCYVGQQGCPCIWIEVDTSMDRVERRFQIFGTGHPVPDGFIYVGTALDEPFVWHVFEKVTEN
jgi:hypothetical protein